ncbi:uncharacterized protein LOC112639325 [Camponotus floridanus]|uniref:uncharacterized protein LOC112638242 n=1 Tax=Camponotus floridanus TaxID=104421 RepID=UPI000DC6668B|nr:uncharacterized protein LOC112638242 [Camponotus floridanus]XP_025268598.1 uncharacterized protein LOC112639325 [Camponotus floridanus]
MLLGLVTKPIRLQFTIICSNISSIGIVKKIGRFSVAILWQEVLIVSCYVSPNCDQDTFEEFLDELTDCVAFAKSDILVAGDFNSQSMLWGSPITNVRGDILARWSATHGLTLVNTGTQPTCIRSQGSSIVDLTWTSATLSSKISDWTILDQETYSDHVYILFKVHKNTTLPGIQKKHRYARWAFKKFDKDIFQEALELTCTGLEASAEDTLSASWIQDTLTMACDYTMPRAKPVKKSTVYWWNSIKDLRKVCLTSRRHWQRAKSKASTLDIRLRELEESYRTNKKKLRNAIKQAKSNAWNELISTIENDSWGLPYKIVLKRIRRSKPSISEMLDPEVLSHTITRLFPADPYWNLNAFDLLSEEIVWRKE